MAYLKTTAIEHNRDSTRLKYISDVFYKKKMEKKIKYIEDELLIINADISAKEANKAIIQKDLHIALAEHRQLHQNYSNPDYTSSCINLFKSSIENVSSELLRRENEINIIEQNLNKKVLTMS